MAKLIAAQLFLYEALKWVRSTSKRYDPCIPSKVKRFIPPIIKPVGGGLGDETLPPEGGLGDHPQGSDGSELRPTSCPQ